MEVRLAKAAEVGLRVERRTVSAPAAAHAALRAFVEANGGHGWVCTTDRVAYVDGVAAVAALQGFAPLTAELVSEDRRRSLSLAYLDPEQGWQVVVLEETAGAGDYRRVEHRYVAVDPDLGRPDARAGAFAGSVRYHEYWPVRAELEGIFPGECPQVGPVAVRFVGLEHKEDAR